MCIIIYAPKGHIPKKHLANSLKNNDDGWGVMYADAGKVCIVRGMTPVDFHFHWKWIKKLPGPKVFHARIATHGAVDENHCHPFRVPNHNELAVAHNGVIIQQTGKSSGTGSDTMNFNDNILAHLPEGFQNLQVYHDLLSDYIGYSKLVFMDGEGQVQIVNEEKGSWHDENWYSNNSFRDWNAKYTVGPYTRNETPSHSATTVPYTMFYDDGPEEVWSQKDLAYLKDEEFRARALASIGDALNVGDGYVLDAVGDILAEANDDIDDEDLVDFDNLSEEEWCRRVMKKHLNNPDADDDWPRKRKSSQTALISLPAPVTPPPSWAPHVTMKETVAPLTGTMSASEYKEKLRQDEDRIKRLQQIGEANKDIVLSAVEAKNEMRKYVSKDLGHLSGYPCKILTETGWTGCD